MTMIAALLLAWLAAIPVSEAAPARACGTLGAGDLNTWHGVPWKAAPTATVRRTRAAEVVLDRLTVRGSLDREIVRRIIVRWHLDDVKSCYVKVLTKMPELKGRIAVQFTVSVTGAVSSSELVSSTLGNARVEKCVVNVVRGWEFPRTMGGGTTLVTVAFDFSPTRRGMRQAGGILSRVAR